MLDTSLIHDQSDKAIRPAVFDDIPAIVVRGADFFLEAGWTDIADYSPTSMDDTLRNMIGSDGGIVLVAYEGDRLIGMAGGLVYPAYFNAAHRTGQELFWWVDPVHRHGLGARLLRELEQAARDAGAQSWAMFCLARHRPDAVGHLYERRGYRPSERSYIKRL